MHTTQFPALVHCIFLAVTVFPSRQPAKHRPAWRILVPIFMIQRCLHFVDTFEALIYYIRWYKLKKGGPTLSVDSPNIDQYKKSALLCSKALSGAPSGTLPRSKNAPLGRFFALLMPCSNLWIQKRTPPCWVVFFLAQQERFELSVRF